MTDEPTPIWKLKAQQRQEAKKQHPSSFESDLVPERPFERSEDDIEMDRVIDRISFWDIYNKYVDHNQVGKKVGGEVQISCPVPGHTDRHPSASVTPDGVWKCHGTCDTGGDKLDIAAMYYGMEKDYKDGKNFHELRRRIAEDFGHIIQRTSAGTIITPPEPEPPKLAVVKSISGDDDDEEDLDDLGYVMETAGIPWRDFIEDDTFWGKYMKAVTIDDLPEEYHFMCAATLLSVAAGHGPRIAETKPVVANINVCMVGPTGSGKTQATGHMYRLLERALPFNPDPSQPCGVNVFTPSSGEAIFDEMSRVEPNPASPKAPGIPHPVVAIADFNEFRDFVGKGARLGNTLKDTVMALSDNNTSVLNQVTRGRGRISIVKPFLCIVTTTQPGSLPILLSEGDVTSGLVNRIILAPGVKKKRFAINRQVIDIEPAVKPLMDIHGWAASFKDTDYVEWSDEAFNLFTEFFNDKIMPAKEGRHQAILGRLDLTMKKFVLLFAINRFEKAISRRSVEDAIKVYDYILNAYTSAADQIHQDSSSRGEREQKIIDAANRKMDKMDVISVKDVKQNLKRHKDITYEDVFKTLENLAKAGVLHMFKMTGSDNRSSWRFRRAD